MVHEISKGLGSVRKNDNTVALQTTIAPFNQTIWWGWETQKDHDDYCTYQLPQMILPLSDFMNQTPWGIPFSTEPVYSLSASSLCATKTTMSCMTDSTSTKSTKSPLSVVAIFSLSFLLLWLEYMQQCLFHGTNGENCFVAHDYSRRVLFGYSVVWSTEVIRHLERLRKDFPILCFSERTRSNVLSLPTSIVRYQLLKPTRIWAFNNTSSRVCFLYGMYPVGHYITNNTLKA